VNRVGARSQAAVDRYFGAQAPYWRDVYAEEGLQGLIYRERMARALRWIDDLGPGAGATALEAGSGAGRLAVELAERGLHVTAIDSSDEMVRLTAQAAREAGVSASLASERADVHGLPFEAGAFELVVALGVIPWLHDPRAAVGELGRVLAPGGLLVLSADNLVRLNALVGQNPLLEPVKRLYYALARSRGRAVASRSRLYSPWSVERMLAGAALRVVRRTTIGFGPMTVLGRPLFDGERSLRLHALLQARSDRGGRVIRWLGWHYLVAARKRA
jgi:SAM-dependent methyltransferase